MHRWVSPKGPDLDLPGSHGPVRVDDDSEEGLLVLLVGHLRVDVDPGQPAPVAWVAVIPGGSGRAARDKDQSEGGEGRGGGGGEERGRAEQQIESNGH